MSNLLVQNIKHTNGTTAQTIDSTGRITTPARPSFMVRGFQSSSTDFTTGSESATINGVTPNNMKLCYNYHEVTHNIGNHFNNASGRFTCPIAGLYLVTMHVGYLAAVNYCGMALYVSSNAATGLGDHFIWSEDNNRHDGMTIISHVNASAGQQFLMGIQATYTTPASSSGDIPYTSFACTFLG